MVLSNQSRSVLWASFLEIWLDQFCLQIALSVLSSVAAVYSVFRTWVWYRRSAKVTVELVTLIRFLIFAADILSNVIFLVVFLSTFYWLITFRQQHEVIVTLPKEGDEQFIKDLVISAFVLKVIVSTVQLVAMNDSWPVVVQAASVLAMIGDQCCVNVFMIDWENPRPAKADSPVSAWRMYFVANEWNEIQVIRKSGVSLQIVLVLLILKVCTPRFFRHDASLTSLSLSSGLEFRSFRAGTSNIRFPHRRTVVEIQLFTTNRFGSYNIPFNRFAADPLQLARLRIVREKQDSAAHRPLYYVQHQPLAAGPGALRILHSRKVIYFLLLPTRDLNINDASTNCRKPLMNCYFHFGYRNRSPHGFSDTDMQTMCQQLQKEEDNLCAQRGLVQGQDGQTFTLSLHSNLIEAWSRLLVPSNSAVINATSLSTTSSGSKSTYDSLNKFLVSFLDHVHLACFHFLSTRTTLNIKFRLLCIRLFEKSTTKCATDTFWRKFSTSKSTSQWIERYFTMVKVFTTFLKIEFMLKYKLYGSFQMDPLPSTVSFSMGMRRR